MVEGHAVVDAVAVAAGHLEHVAALAVGVVDDDVEHRHPPERVGVLVDQRDRGVVLVDPVEDVAEAGRQDPLGDDRHRLLVGVGLPPQLHHPRAVGPVAAQRRRDDVPPGGLGDQVGGDLTVGEGAVGEVPQRPLARDRLVDDLDGVDLADERGVGGGHDPPVEHQLAVDEPLRDPHGSRRLNPLARTQR